tara:strand:- start:320 stop:568 length:249 start_codon:yes stop_codon:yes gene_type:complete
LLKHKLPPLGVRKTKLNYIQKLQDEVLNATLESAKTDDQITDFLNYLQSKKFWNDSRIQVNEVNKFLMELRMSLPLKEKYTK